VDVVVVYDGAETINSIFFGLSIAGELQQFYKETCDVDLQISVSGSVRPKWISRDDYVRTVMLDHRFIYGGKPFLVIVRSDISKLPDRPFLGEAFGILGGPCVVAGDQPPGPATAGVIAVHELGHTLLGPNHQDGTFMGSALERENRIVTPEQRSMIRATALRFGGS
jgi:hypothetical protein